MVKVLVNEIPNKMAECPFYVGKVQETSENECCLNINGVPNMVCQLSAEHGCPFLSSFGIS